MKKYCMLAAALVLALSVFTGCRRRPEMTPTDNATLMPSETVTIPTTEMTEAMPTENGSTSSTDAADMIPGGIDPDNNTESTNGAMEGRSGRRAPQTK